MAEAPGNIRYTIYPTTAIFTASYSASGGSFTFTNSDCTIVDDHLSYTSPTVNIIGTTTINAYNHEYTYETYDGAANVTVNLPIQNLYAWTTVDSTARSAGLPFTFYTTNPDPSALLDQWSGSNLVFDGNENDITSTFLYGGSTHFSQADTSTVTWTTYDPI